MARMNRFLLLAFGCVLMSACNEAGNRQTSTAPAVLPYPRALPVNMPSSAPNNIMMPGYDGQIGMDGTYGPATPAYDQPPSASSGQPPPASSGQDTSASYGQVPPAPSTVMAQGSLYGGPPAGAEDKAVNMYPVPDPGAYVPAAATATTTPSGPVTQQAPVYPDATDNSAYPIAQPVAGHPGMVYSPFGTQDQWVDVSAYPPGSKVRSPYSGKLFRTPED
jgi:hypothetical protein